MQLKTKLVLAHVKTRNSARPIALFPVLLPFYSLLDAPAEGEAKEGSTKGGEGGQNQTAPRGRHNSSSDDDNEARPVVPEGPADVVRTMEVLAEPLLEVTPEGFTKEVVKLEDGDLNQWPQLFVRIENLLTASEKDGVVHVAVVYDATCVRLPLTPGSLTTVAHTSHAQAVGFKGGCGCHQDVSGGFRYDPPPRLHWLWQRAADRMLGHTRHFKKSMGH